MKRINRLLSGVLTAAVAAGSLLVPCKEVQAATVAIDSKNFPDRMFWAFAKSFDEDQDDVLSQAELMKIKRLDMINRGIESLQGIQFFKDLEYLNCEFNKITEIDLSGFTKLEYLKCYANDLTSLNVSGCTSLKTLICPSNDLTTLDLTSCTSLETLNCGQNKLTSLDVSKNTNLKNLSVITTT